MTGRFTIPGVEPATDPPRDAPAPSDFERLFALVALVGDHKACAKRLEELRATTEAASKASADLDAKRAAHDQQVARALADIEQQRRALREREVQVHAAEALVRHERERLAKLAADLDLRDDRFETFPGGMTRLKEHIGV